MREEGEAVFLAFGLADEDELLVKIKILYAQVDDLAHSQTRTISQSEQKAVFGIGGSLEQTRDLWTGEDGWQALGFFGVAEGNGALPVHMAQAVIDGVDRDAQGRSGDMVFAEAMQQIGLDLGFGELTDRPAVEAVKLAYNIGIGLDSALAIVAQAHLSLEQFNEIRHNKKWVNP